MTEPRHTSNRLWSHSCLDAFRCPLRWWLQYEEKRPGVPVLGYTVGSEVHGLLESYLKHLAAKKRSTDTTFARSIAGRAGAEAQAMFLRFADQVSVPAEQIEAVELWLTAELPEDLGTFRGRVDLLLRDEGDLYHLIDYKSRWEYDPPPEVAPVQLSRYAWLLSRQEQYARCDLHAQQVFVGSNTAWGWDFWPPLSSEEVVEAVKRIKAETRWRAEPGNHCANCPYVLSADCPEVGLPEVWTDFEDAVRFVRRARGQASATAAWVREQWPTLGIAEVDGQPVGARMTEKHKATDPARLIRKLLDDEDKRRRKLPNVTPANLAKLADNPEYADLIETVEATEFAL